MQLRYVALILAALSLAPVLAFNGAISGSRPESAAVASDATSFLTVANLGPSTAAPVSLATGNGYEEDALTVTNAYSTTVAVQGTLTTNPGDRFKISNPAATLAAGAAHTFKLEDQVSNHPRTCTSVVIQVDAYVGGTGGSRQGHAVVARQVFVEVKGGC